MSTLLQENPEISIAGQEIKRIDYEYDLISGKVNKVIYQQDSADMFIHRYDYDADNRITHVWTSSDDVIWNQDAKYFYYAHGPLARVEYGHDKVQGLDYAYTLQGWIKGVNSSTLSTNRDMGRDGDADTANVNSLVNKDAFSYSLGYYDEDYRAIDRLKWNTVTDRFEAQTTGGEFMAQRKELFNGNISHMVTTLSTPDTTGGGLANDQNVLPQVMAYRYDQLNRLKNGVAFDNIDIPNNLWEASGQAVANMYKNTFTYDANGNILSQYRNDETGTRFDSLTYRYKEIGGDKVHNRLYHVNDASAFTSMKTDDIDDQGAFVSTPQTINNLNNYMYDEIGNMKADSTEEVDTITWTVYGKIKEISRVSGSSKKRLLFDYDASSNRIAKHVYTGYTWENSTYYSRDAQGNVMGTYKQEVVSSSMSYLLKEQHLYGSNRIGMKVPDLEMIGATIDTSSYADTLGKKIFEGSNRLGNVLTTFNDRKIAVDTNSDFITDFRLADVLSSTDYYSFGAPMYARDFDFSGRNYKYGFNGKESDDEAKGSGNSYDFGARIYDSRLGRWLSTDPLQVNYPAISPYVFALNNPLKYIDIDGKWVGDVNVVIVIGGDGKKPTQHQGDWTIIYAESTEQAVALMGSKDGLNMSPGSIDNLIIMQHGQGGSTTASGVATPETGQMFYDRDLKAYKDNPEAFSKKEPFLHKEFKATEELGKYLKNDATVLNTACGGANEDSFVKNYAEMITNNLGESNTVQVILSDDNTEYVSPNDHDISTPVWSATNAGIYNPLIGTEHYEKGATVLYNTNGAMSKTNQVYIDIANPSNKNAISIKKQTPSGGNSGGAKPPKSTSKPRGPEGY